MISVNEIRNSAMRMMAKDEQGNIFNPATFNAALLYANKQYFHKCVGLDEGNNAMYWQVSNRISESLKYLIRRSGDNGAGYMLCVDGISDFPDDMECLSTVRFAEHPTGKYAKLELVPDHIFKSRVDSPSRYPTARRPIGTYRVGGLEVAPGINGYIDISYLRMPKTPFWDYNRSADGLTFLEEGETHDGTLLPLGTASRTQNVEFTGRDYNDFLMLVVEHMGLHNKDNMHLQNAKQHKATGE